MNLTALKTWVSGETLTASDLNAEYQNIYNHTITNSDIDSTGTYVLGELVVGSGITAADGGQLHVHTASAGSVSAHADANEAVLENSAASGLSILSGSSSDGNIFFGDAADNDIGKIAYSHSANSLAFTTNGTTALTLSSAQAATFAGDVNVGGALTLTGGISLNGNTTIGDSASDTLTINSTITSHLKFTDATYDIGASGATRPRHLYLSGNGVLGGTLGATGLVTATAGVTSGSNIVSDTDSTDDLGTTSVRWANLYADSIGDSGQALAVKATTLSFDAASTIDTSGNNNLTLDAGTATLTLDANTIESDASTLSFDAAATIDTSGNNNLSLDAGTATLTLDAGTIESDAGTLSFDAAASIDTSGNNALAINTGSANLNVTAGTLALTGAQTISSTLAVTGVSTLTGRVGIGGSTVTDGHLLNIQGSTASDNVGVVLNKTNSTAQIWAINNTGTLNFNNFTSSLVPLQISSNNETTFKPSSSNGNLTVKVGSINSDSIRLEAGGTTSTWLESRGYLGHSWYVDSTRSMTLDSTGLGVGVESPDTLLHVQSSTASDLIKVSGTGTDSNPNIQIANDARSYNLQVVGARSDAFEIWDRDAAATRLSISTSGNVGIGVSPTQKLHVAGDVLIDTGTTSTLYFDANTNWMQLISGDFRWGLASTEYMRLDSSGNLTIQNTTTNSNPFFKIKNDAREYNLQVAGARSDNFEIYDNTAGTQRLTILSDGKIGCGTASPYMNAVVGVAPTVAATTIDETSDLAGAFVIGNNVASNFGDRIPLVFNVSSASDNNISAAIMGEREGSSWDSALSFWTNNVFDGVKTDTIQEKMRLTSDGYLGVGSTTPRYNLSVKGNSATAVGIAVDNDSGSGALDITALGASYGAHGAAAGEIWLYSPDNINIGGATGNTNDIKFLGGGGEKARIRTSGGITFGGATADASALDFYEEGTFSPALGSGSASYSEQLGSYTRIGNVVFINVSLTWTGGPTSGNLVIGTLPFTSSSTLQSYSPLGQVANNSLTVSGYEIAGYISANSTLINFTNQTSGTGSTNKTYEAAGTIRITGHYFV